MHFGSDEVNGGPFEVNDLGSPEADALALTYARRVFPRDTLVWFGNSNNVVSDYDPFAPESEWPDRRNESRLIERYAPRFPEGTD